MRHRTVMLCVSALALSASAPLAQTSDKLVGSWKLIEASATTSGTGLVDHAPFGTDLTGTVIYTPNGRVAVLISYGGRKPLSGSDRIAAPAEERAEAFKTFFAYSGRYSVTADKVTHHVEVASYQNWVNTDLVRTFTLTGKRLTLRTPQLSVGEQCRSGNSFLSVCPSIPPCGKEERRRPAVVELRITFV